MFTFSMTAGDLENSNISHMQMNYVDPIGGDAVLINCELSGGPSQRTCSDAKTAGIGENILRRSGTYTFNYLRVEDEWGNSAVYTSDGTVTGLDLWETTHDWVLPDFTLNLDPTYTPAPTSTPVPPSTPVSPSCAGRTIKFKIGNVWANESIVWTQGEVTVLNLTASSAILPSTAGTSWPILARLSAPAQRVVPHAVLGNVNASDHTLISAWADGVQVATAGVIGGSYSMTNVTNWPLSVSAQVSVPHAVLGSVNAADGTSISAWYGDTQLASTNASGGSYPVLLIEDGNCVSITAPSV